MSRTFGLAPGINFCDLSLSLLDSSAYAVTAFVPIFDSKKQVVDFYYAFVNQKAADVLGKNVKKLISKRLTKVYPGVHETNILKTFIKVFKTGKTKTIEVFYNRDGLKIWFYIKISKVHQFLVTDFKDITAQKQREEKIRKKEKQLHDQLKASKALLEKKVEERTRALKKKEMELEASERFLNSIFNHVPMGIALTDSEGCYEKVNKAYCRMYGYKPKELLGKSFLKIVTPRDRSFWQKDHKLYVKGKSPLRETEVERVSKDGRRLQVLLHRKEIISPNGEKKVVSIAWDITERKRMEETLKANDELLESILERAPVGVTIIDEKGKFLRVNKRYCAIYGYKKEEIEGKHFQDVIIPKEHRDIWNRNFIPFLV